MAGLFVQRGERAEQKQRQFPERRPVRIVPDQPVGRQQSEPERWHHEQRSRYSGLLRQTKTGVGDGYTEHQKSGSR
ncbi:hypothetical protein D3C85_1706940 [compost metagenome]